MVTTYRPLGVVEDFSCIVFCHHLSHNVRRDVLNMHIFLKRKRERAYASILYHNDTSERGRERERQIKRPCLRSKP